MLNQRLRAYRELRGLSLSELARQSGVSKAYLSQIENGRSRSASADKLYDLASALGVTLYDLMGRPALHRRD